MPLQKHCPRKTQKNSRFQKPDSAVWKLEPLMKKIIFLVFSLLFSGLSFGAESYTTSCSYWSSARQDQTCTRWRTTQRLDGSYTTSCAYWSSLRKDQTCTRWRTTQQAAGFYETSCSYWSSLRKDQTCASWRTTQQAAGFYETSCSYWSSLRKEQTCVEWITE